MALVLVFAMLCSMGVLADTPTTDTEPTYTTTTTAEMAMYKSTPKALTIESYAINNTVDSKSVEPCDIIFVLDQSRWVNGDQGEERAEILAAMRDLLNSLEEPTNGDEHRIAIAGYGRVNVGFELDSYNASTYPGARQTGSYSLNTGYYTANGFQSTKGWTEVKDSTTADLPTMPTSYQEGMTYNNAFMTVDEAESVLGTNSMLSWYSGASRMDAGLTLAEQLAAVATQNDTKNNRNLIVCVVASSLPIQNYKSTNYIRTDAVKAAANVLKEQGATIFALGDYHNSGKNLAADTKESFESTMTEICGSSDTAETDKGNYFFSRTKSGSIVEALNDMVTSISTTVAESVLQEIPVTVESVTTRKGKTIDTDTWLPWLQKLAAQGAEANIEYCNYSGNEYGDLEFDYNIYGQTTVPLSQLLQADGTLRYTAELAPLPHDAASGGTTIEGNKITITITGFVTVNFAWLSSEADYAPSDVSLPASKTLSMYGFYLDEPQTEDEHYRFDSWYYDEDGDYPVDGMVSPWDDMTFYGKWTRFSYVRYHEELTHVAGEAVDEASQVECGSALTDLLQPTLEGYTFAGWYTDTALTQAFPAGTPVTNDLDLYAKWTPNEDTGYKVIYYQQNFDNDAYTQLREESLTGTTGKDVEIAAAPDGYEVGHVTYAATDTTAQADALPIQPDGSLVVCVYYDLKKYTVSYDTDGGFSDTEDYSVQTVKHGTAVTVKTAPTKTGYTFNGWNDGTTTHGAGQTITVTGNVTLTAQWTANTGTKYTVKYYQQNLTDSGYTEVSADAENLTGTTGAEIKEINKTYTGFTRSATTYAATGKDA
jgi:uncharacterized repeat protein (TIGR02543 family)